MCFSVLQSTYSQQRLCITSHVHYTGIYRFLYISARIIHAFELRRQKNFF